MTKERVIRDPVHNLIGFGSDPLDALIIRLIDTPEFQRLRRIRQLGFSELVFPGATHTRFAHSIGVMYIARRMLDRLGNIGISVDQNVRTVVLCAALLHDIGHGPFSHAFEKITRTDHERYTRRIIEDQDTSVNSCLRDFDVTLPDSISSFFDDDPDENTTGDIPPYMVRVITSQFDADRADYLLRDSLATGTQYGRYDLDWLLEHLCLDEANNRFYFDKKSIPAVESYVFARFHMYQSVYYHKATRAAEVMLRLLFSRYRELLSSGEDTIVPDAPPLIRNAFKGVLDLQAYLALDESLMFMFLRVCMNSTDPHLSKLGRGLVERRLYKAIDTTGIDPDQNARFYAEAKNLVEEQTSSSDYGFAADSPSDLPYKPYQPDKARDQIFVEDSYGKVRELTEVAESIKSLTTPRKMLRYYCNPELRDGVCAIRNSIFGEA